MNHPKVLVLRAAGVNCELETAGAFAAVGGKPELVHISELRGGKKRLMDYAVLAIPGGFSYGDDVGAGKVLANQIRHTLTDLRQFVRLGRPVIGICNGFQALVKSGILPHSNACDQTASFTVNDSGRFEARCGLLSLDGWRKDDPDSILGLDTYRLVLTENGRALVGPTRSHGDWEGRFEATRADAAPRPAEPRRRDKEHE